MASHRVPLSGDALALLKAIKASGLHDMLVFPSPQLKTLSDMSLTVLLRRVKAESDTPGRCATAHGFRSSFRDWASEQGYSRDLAERALAHTIANKVKATPHFFRVAGLRAAIVPGPSRCLSATSRLNRRMLYASNQQCRLQRLGLASFLVVKLLRSCSLVRSKSTNFRYGRLEPFRPVSRPIAPKPMIPISI